MSSNESPLVSVIIPVYNSEQYLRQCLDSVIGQTYKKLEIIIVDDGSEDSSPDICREYASKDNRIRVIEEENGGQAVARNTALDIMTGDYVFFVDADDYISFDAIEVLIQESQKSGCLIVHGYARKFWENGKEEKLSFPYNETKYFTDTEVMHNFCYQRIFYAGPVAKIIHKDIMSRFRFPANRGYEDYAIMYKVLSAAPRTALIPHVLYYYRQHSNSTMHTEFNPKKIDRIRIASELKEFIDTNYPSESLAVKTRFLLANIQLCMDIPFSSDYKPLRSEVYGNIKSVRKDVIGDRESKLSLRLMAVTTYLGIHATLCLGRLYKKVFI
ncbi:MAG: glycosyltransferase family 2 protein [Clostridiales bacterium]|nr:glycosyltransferase family 2 protein [Clostridiales bacterium]